jgi:N-acetylmuramoyl-L-alanine amidase
VDAGHGGRETGAVGPTGLIEKDVTLAVAERVVRRLRAAGVSAVLTRTADYRMTLYSRTEVARRVGAKALISVHFNAEPDGPTSAPGTEVYYQVASADSRRLAGLLYEDIVTDLARREVDWVGDRDAGVKYRRNIAGDDYYGLLRHSHGVPAALIEPLFISSPSEEALLRSEDVRAELADAIARGALRFLHTQDPGSGWVEPYARSGGVGGGDAVPPGCEDPAL